MNSTIFLNNQIKKFSMKGLTLIPVYQKFNYTVEAIKNKKEKEEYWKWAYTPEWYKLI